MTYSIGGVKNNF